MNTILGIIWGMINPEMFAAVADTYVAPQVVSVGLTLMLAGSRML
jgi:hypothetical protein